jgi:multidrug transporter EmrE-like cation transporter
MNYFLFVTQALISAAGVLILRANLDGFTFRNSISGIREFGPILLGILIYGLSFLMWLAILSRTNVSIAYPITIGLTLVFTLLGARLFLDETLSIQAAIGVTLITIGVIVGGSKSI